MANVFFVLSLVFLAAATIGLLRFPDVYTRLHATALGDTLGISLAICGLITLVPSNVLRLKFVLVLLIFLVINPTTSHFIGKVALLHGTRPCSVPIWIGRKKRGS